MELPESYKKLADAITLVLAPKSVRWPMQHSTLLAVLHKGCVQREAESA
jgi:hypothetical protein